MRKAKFGPGLFLSLFALSLLLAFGIGYKLGGQSIAAAPITPASSVRSTFSAALPPATPKRVPQAVNTPMLWSSSGRTKYTLYLASFQNVSEAEKEKSRLEAKGLRGIEISERRLPGQTAHLWYRLGYGRFDSRDAAVEVGRQLTDRGLIRDFWPKELL